MNNQFIGILVVILIVIIYLFIIQYCWNTSIAQITNTQNISLYQTFLIVVVIATLLHAPLFITL